MDRVKERDESFDYMIHHFSEMVDGDRIKHFDIQNTTWELSHTYFRLENVASIQRELISWIQAEKESGRWEDRENWKAFPGNKIFGTGVLVTGYRKLFVHEWYYLQLVLDPWCVDRYCCCSMDRRDCVDCDENRSDDDSDDDSDNGKQIHFELAVYGWKGKWSNKDTGKLQPDNEISIPHDQMISDFEWNQTSTRKERRSIQKKEIEEQTLQENQRYHTQHLKDMEEFSIHPSEPIEDYEELDLIDHVPSIRQNIVSIHPMLW
uniref:Uncharacterized protein n=1 Tax=viral metagenome TaxID=1070528 RepID=A0A6C0KVF8_9ZZZZ